MINYLRLFIPIPDVSALHHPVTADQSVCLFFCLFCCAMFVSLFLVCSFMLYFIPGVFILQRPVTMDRSECYVYLFVFCFLGLYAGQLYLKALNRGLVHMSVPLLLTFS